MALLKMLICVHKDVELSCQVNGPPSKGSTCVLLCNAEAMQVNHEQTSAGVLLYLDFHIMVLLAYRGAILVLKRERQVNKKPRKERETPRQLRRNEEMKRDTQTESFYTKGKVTKCS